MKATGTTTSTASDADTVVRASRALLGVVARSMTPALAQVTVAQFRVLVLLSTTPSGIRNADLAAATGVHASTFTRTTDRMIVGGWVERRENPEDRRETHLVLTETGAQLVDEVTERRRADITRVLELLGPDEYRKVVDGLEAFADAAGEPPLESLDGIGL